MLSHTTQSTSAASLFYNKFLHRNWTWPSSCPLLPSVSEGERKIQNQPGVLLPPHRAAFTSTLKPDSYFFTLHFPVPGAHTQTYDLTYLIGDAPLLSMKRYFVSMTSFVFPVSSNADFISMLTNLQTGKGNRDNEKKSFKPQQSLSKAVKLVLSGHWCHQDSPFHLKCAFPHRWTPPALSWTAGGGGSRSFAFQSRFWLELCSTANGGLPYPPAVQHGGVGSPPLGQEAKLTWQRTGGTAAMRGDGLVAGFSK